MVVAAHYGFGNIAGIDFAIELCRQANSNCQQITNKYPLACWRVMHENAAEFNPSKHTHVIFFFNPFNEVIMKRVIRNISKSLNRYPRKLFIVYVNPQHKKVLINNGFKEVYYFKKMRFVEASIFENL